MNLIHLLARRRLPSGLLSLVVSLFMAAALSGASAATVESGYVYTGQAGAQTFINRTASSSFYLTASDTADLLGANLRMKMDGANKAPITFTLFAPDKTTVLESKTLTYSEFCSIHGGDCSSFDQVYFRFDNPYPLSPGLAYYATVTSSALTTSTYFIKGADVCSIKTGGGITISGTTCSSNPPPASPSLSVSKSGPASADPGGVISYQLTVTNVGSGNATRAQVKDLLPADVSYTGFSGSGWSCSVAAGTVTCNYTGTIGTSAPGNSKTVTINATVSNPVSADSLDNVASVDPIGGTNAISPANCSTSDFASGVCDSFSTDVNIAGPYLAVTVSDPSPVLRPGSDSTYTVTVTNHGETPTSGPTHVYNYIPAGSTFVSAGGNGWTCDASDLPLLDCTYSGTIERDGQPGSVTSFPVVVTTPGDTPGGTSFTNTAYVGRSGGTIDPPPSDPGSCSSSSTISCDANTSAVAQPGFTVEKSAPQPALQVGEQSTYTLTVTTDGTAVPAEVQDQLPAGLTYVSASSSNPGWDCGVDGSNLVTCRNTISSGTAQQIHVTVQADASISGQTVTNYAAAGPEGNVPEPGPACEGQDCDFSPSPVSPAATFSLSKSAPEPALQVNKQSTYTLTVTTTSAAPSVPVDVKDQLPVGMSFVSASGGWSCSVDDANLLLCQKAVAGGSTEQLSVTVTTGPQLNNQTVTNYASASAEGRAPEPGPNCVPDGSDAVCAASPAAEVADVREEIKRAVEDDVQAYMAARLDEIVGSFDPRSRLQSFRDTACGASHDMSMSGEATSHDQNLSANGTFSLKGSIVPTADVPDQCNSRTNVWAQLDVGYVDGLDDSSSTGGMITVGAEYLVSDNFLAGLRLSMDYADASFDSDANSEISGLGWLAGPYISAEIAHNLFVDGFVGYGTSWNDYSGNYENLDLSGDFTTQRIAGYLNLSGSYDTGALVLTPLVGVSFGKEWSDSFDVHNAIVGDTSIASQEAGLGRLKGRLEAGYMVTEDAEERLEVFLAPQVTYDFLRDGGPHADLLLGDGMWRGGVEGGFRFARNSFGSALLLGYDGIGVSDWNAYRGQLQLNYTW